MRLRENQSLFASLAKNYEGRGMSAFISTKEIQEKQRVSNWNSKFVSYEQICGNTQILIETKILVHSPNRNGESNTQSFHQVPK